MKTIRLLTIGNSFANDALSFLENIADGTGEVRFEIGRANLGGCSLEKHWNLGLYTARHPEYKTYRLRTAADSTLCEMNLQEALAVEPWDIVTLQQVSNKSWRRETFQPYLGQLHNLVRRSAPRAVCFLHQTWAYRTDSPFFPQNSLTQESMFERIRSNYDHFSRELGCPLLPSGEAVQQARRAPGRHFVWPDPGFEYQNPDVAPALPCQDHSLAVGWLWAINNSPEGIPELRHDANHLNALGRYLIGCVWFERLSGLDVRKSSFAPDGIDDDTVAFLRHTAHDVCSRHHNG